MPWKLTPLNQKSTAEVRATFVRTTFSQLNNHDGIIALWCKIHSNKIAKPTDSDSGKNKFVL